MDGKEFSSYASFHALIKVTWKAVLGKIVRSNEVWQGRVAPLIIYDCHWCSGRSSGIHCMHLAPLI